MKHLTKYFAVALLFVTPLFAQNARGPAPDQSEMQKRMAEMCADRSAQTAGELAYLETKLGLTEIQKPLFDRWKVIKLVNASTMDCAPPPDREPSVMDGLRHEEAMLKKRIAELKQEAPALESLVAALNTQQLKMFRHTRRGFGPPEFERHEMPGAEFSQPPVDYPVHLTPP